MKKLLTLIALALLAATTVRGEALDSLALLVQRGDSLMKQYNTYEALKYYQQAYDQAKAQGVTRFSMNDDFSMSKPYVPEDRVPRQIRLKLADCQYKRANYRETTELLKNMPEDSLTHEAFRQLANSYRQQADMGSYKYHRLCVEVHAEGFYQHSRQSCWSRGLAAEWRLYSSNQAV